MATQPWPDLPGHCLGEAAHRGLEVCLSGDCAMQCVIICLFCASACGSNENIVSRHVLVGVEGSI